VDSVLPGPSEGGRGRATFPALRLPGQAGGARDLCGGGRPRASVSGSPLMSASWSAQTVAWAELASFCQREILMVNRHYRQAAAITD
jgi:hypothetical protein